MTLALLVRRPDVALLAADTRILVRHPRTRAVLERLECQKLTALEDGFAWAGPEVRWGEVVMDHLKVVKPLDAAGVQAMLRAHRGWVERLEVDSPEAVEMEPMIATVSVVHRSPAGPVAFRTDCLGQHLHAPPLGGVNFMAPVGVSTVELEQRHRVLVRALEQVPPGALPDLVALLQRFCREVAALAQDGAGSVSPWMSVGAVTASGELQHFPPVWEAPAP